MPILLTAKAIQKLSLGQVLEVLGDDPAILEDMPVYCTRAGHRLLEMEKGEEGLVRCLVQKVAEG